MSDNSSKSIGSRLSLRTARLNGLIYDIKVAIETKTGEKPEKASAPFVAALDAQSLKENSVGPRYIVITLDVRSYDEKLGEATCV